MALSANKDVQRKSQPVTTKLKVVNGDVHIYKGALVMYESGNIGYVMAGGDALTREFAGIALEELNVAAADNVSDGTYEVEVLTRGCGEWVLMNMAVNITIANEGDPVYVETDDTVGISGVTNTTGGFVGIIRQFVSTTTAWVQLCQSPIL
jgi:hypothetical protein